jgi:D-alanyl-D-alanine carboxypeptidase
VALSSCVANERDDGDVRNDSVSPVDSSKIVALRHTADSVLTKTKVPGIVAIVRSPKLGLHWSGAIGFADLEAAVPMDTSLVFRIGSISKTMIGVVILQLMDEGKLSLNDTLKKFFPDFSRADKITLRMLCNMTSGVFNYPETAGFMTEMKAKPDRVYALDELFDLASKGKPHNLPGEKFRYSNSNTVILARIIEKVTGHPIQEEINRRVIDPLQLQQTEYLAKGREIFGDHVKGYYEGAYVPGLELSEMYDISWIGPAGCVSSSPPDMMRYAKALVEGFYFSDSTHQVFLTDVKNVRSKVDYGICVFKRGSFYGHNCGIPGYTASLYHSIEKDCTILIYYNAQLEGVLADALFYRFVSILYGDAY